jgi:hypothetical protein
VLNHQEGILAPWHLPPLLLLLPLLLLPLLPSLHHLLPLVLLLLLFPPLLGLPLSVVGAVDRGICLLERLLCSTGGGNSEVLCAFLVVLGALSGVSACVCSVSIGAVSVCEAEQDILFLFGS